MKYKYIDTNGNVINDLNDKLLKDEISKSYKLWLEGSGDAAIESSNNIDLIILKLETGIFIMQLSDYTTPLINTEEETKVLTHYVGGEPMKIPSNCLCNEETAFKIIKYFIENDGELHPDYNWIDIYELIPDELE